MKVNIKGFITCKKSEQLSDCADNYAFNETTKRFAISDGVSKSFFPKLWSEVLVNQYIDNIILDEKSLIKSSQVEWQHKIDEMVKLPETKWYTKSQYNARAPALATFVGLQFLVEEKNWKATAIGDSFLFFIPKGFTNYKEELLTLSSKTGNITFDNFPDYWSSIGELHKGTTLTKIGDLIDGTFYLMTDALAEWFIKNGETAIEKMRNLKDQLQFENYIEQEREGNRIANDDSAVLIIEISECTENGFDLCPPKLTILKQLIEEQEAKKADTKKVVEEKTYDNNKEFTAYSKSDKHRGRKSRANKNLSSNSNIKLSKGLNRKKNHLKRIKLKASNQKKEGVVKAPGASMFKERSPSIKKQIENILGNIGSEVTEQKKVETSAECDNTIKKQLQEVQVSLLFSNEGKDVPVIQKRVKPIFEKF